VTESISGELGIILTERFCDEIKPRHEGHILDTVEWLGADIGAKASVPAGRSASPL
jgi:hypothetical protein